MIVIVGLGNPGKEYMLTRHNVGFMVVEKLADRLNIDWQFKDNLKSTVAKDSQHILIKPTTYVNLSGEAVKAVQDFYKANDEQVWVIHDDTEIPFGSVRIKYAGTSGGHNGIKSIDEMTGENYWRIKVGVGRPENKNLDLSDYVLGQFTPEEQLKLPAVVDQVADYLLQSIKDKQLQPVTINYING